MHLSMRMNDRRVKRGHVSRRQHNSIVLHQSLSLSLYISQILARCPLFSSLKRTRDHVHTHRVAGAPSQLIRALRNPHTNAHKCPLPRLRLTPGCRWYALRSLSSVSLLFLLAAALCRRMVAGDQVATARPPARGKRVEKGGELPSREAQRHPPPLCSRLAGMLSRAL